MVDTPGAAEVDIGLEMNNDAAAYDLTIPILLSVAVMSDYYSYNTLHLGSLYVVVPILALNLRNAGNSDYITSKVDSQLIGILLNCYFF